MTTTVEEEEEMNKTDEEEKKKHFEDVVMREGSSVATFVLSAIYILEACTYVKVSG